MPSSRSFFAARDERHESGLAAFLGKLALVPSRLQPRLAGNDPNLEKGRIDVFQIKLGMDNAGAGAHDLNVARRRAAFVAQAVTMSDVRAGPPGWRLLPKSLKGPAKFGILKRKNANLVIYPQLEEVHQGGTAIAENVDAN